MEKIKRLLLPFLIVLTLLVIYWAYKNISLPSMVLWDEGGYLWQGYQIRQTFKLGDWSQFWRLTKAQFYYPFIQSWYLGLFDSARLGSVLLLLPSVILIWLISHNWLAALVFLTSPLVLFFYSTALKEGLGTVLTLFSVWFYFQARRRKNIFWYFVTGLLLLVLTLTKYNYGLLVLGAVGLEILIFNRRSWLVFLPVVLGLVWWLSPPGYLNWFLEIIQNKWQVTLNDTNLVGHLLYYPATTIFEYTFSPLVGIILWVGFIYGAFKNRQKYQFRVLSFLFLINFFLAEKHFANNQARFIFTTVPAFFIVSAQGLAELYRVIKKFIRDSLFLGLAIPVILAAGFYLTKDLANLPQIVKSAGSHTLGSAVFYEADFQNNDRFDFTRGNWPHILPPAGQPKIADIFDFIFTNIDWRKNVTLVNPINEFPPDLFNFYLAKQRESLKIDIKTGRYSEYLVVLEVASGSRFDTLDYRRTSSPGYAGAKSWALNSGFPVIASRDFPDLGFTVRLLGK